ARLDFLALRSAGRPPNRPSSPRLIPSHDSAEQPTARSPAPKGQSATCALHGSVSLPRAQSGRTPAAKATGSGGSLEGATDWRCVFSIPHRWRLLNRTKVPSLDFGVIQRWLGPSIFLMKSTVDFVRVYFRY